jgi:hypothetical protein
LVNGWILERRLVYRESVRDSVVRIALALLVAACAAGPSPPSAAAQTTKRAAKRGEVPQGVVAATIGRHNVSRVRLHWEAAAGGRGRAVAVSHRAGRVAYAAGSPVLLYQLTTGKPAGSVKSCDSVLRGGLALLERKLVVVCEDRVQIFDAVTLTKVASPTIDAARITAATVAWPRLALGHRDGTIRVYGLDGSPTIEIAVPGPPIDVKSLALSPDGSTIAVAWVQGSIWWWHTREPDKPQRLVRYENESDSVAFDRTGELLAEEGQSNQTTVWSFAGAPKEKTKIKNGAWVKRLLFSHDSRFLVRGGSDGLELAELGGPRRIALDTRGAVEDAALDETGTRIAAADRDGRLTVWAVR